MAIWEAEIAAWKADVETCKAEAKKAAKWDMGRWIRNGSVEAREAETELKNEGKINTNQLRKL